MIRKHTIGFAWLAAAVSACALATTPLGPKQLPNKGGGGSGYRFDNLNSTNTDDELFVCLAFSGGGTRAAALAYGAMVALRQTEIEWPRRERLLDEVDCISSVSGGSFAAAYYGLFPDAFFAEFPRRFLYRNIEGELALQALKPWNWLWLASPYYSRSDLAADFYNDQIFARRTYQALIDRNQRPFVILNATNIGNGERFPFTQNQFDLIGSNLGPYPVGRATAASAAFPFLLSPLTLENHQPILNFVAPTTYEQGAQSQSYYANRSRYWWDESELSYVTTPHPYVQLMDGGLADNIGLRSILEAYEQSNGFIYTRLPRMKRLVIIAVNARTESEDTISNAHHTPHIIPTVAMATATIAMDNYSLETVDFTNRLMTELRQAEDVSRKSGQPLRAPVPYVSEIGFEAIPNVGSRQAFLNVATNFDLPAEQVEGLIYVGCNLVKRDPIFQCLLDNISTNGPRQERDAACGNLSNDIHSPAAERIVCPTAGNWGPAEAAFIVGGAKR
jgi:NTE family protein